MSVSRRIVFLNSIKNKSSHYSPQDIGLVSRLTTDNPYRSKYTGSTHGELFIHWWYRPRTQDRLTSCEIFHLNMLRYFNVMDRVEVIHVRCSCTSVSKAIQYAIGILSSGKASVDFKAVTPNNGWEHDTFKEAVEYSIATGKFVYYTHFKGVSRIGDSSLGIVPRLIRKSTDLDIYYWCYLMYMCLFTAPHDVKAIGPLLHLGMNSSYRNRDVAWSKLCQGNEVFHYCGSFQAFSGKYILDCLSSMGLGSKDSRDDHLWVGDPYTVEMFLSMVSYKDDVYTLDVPYESTNSIYNVYSYRRIPLFMNSFMALYTSNGGSDEL